MQFFDRWRKRSQAKALRERALQSGTLPERIALLEQANRLAIEAGDALGQARTLLPLGQFLDKIGQQARARECWTTALSLAETHWDEQLAGEIKGGLASPYFPRGSSDWEGETLRLGPNREPDSVGAATADVDPEIAALHQTVVQLLSAGRYQEALGPAMASVQLSGERLGADHSDYATSLNNLAELYHDMGDFARAGPGHGHGRRRRDVRQLLRRSYTARLPGLRGPSAHQALLVPRLRFG